MGLSAAVACVLIAALCVPLFLALMRRIRIFEYRASSNKSFDELAREYRRYETRVTLLTLILLGLIAYPIWISLDAGYSEHLAAQPQARFLLAIPPFIWLLPAVFVALFLANLVLRYLLIWMLGRERYAEYVEYNNRKFRIDSWRLFSYLGMILLPLCLLFTLLAFDSYTRIDDDGIVVNGFFGLGEKFYRFDEIEAIFHIESAVTQSPNAKNPPHYVVRFRDGVDFDFHRAPQSLQPGQQQAIIEYLQKATNLGLQRLRPGAA